MPRLPGRNCCWKLPRGVYTALPKAVSRGGFRAEVYRFPVCPPGERKYRQGGGGGRGINELPRMNENFREKLDFFRRRRNSPMRRKLDDAA